jgi:tripartite-type tricarboxylate transporter receptor subunit TctC
MRPRANFPSFFTLKPYFNTASLLAGALTAAISAALNSLEANTRFATLMAEPVASTPEQFGAFMKSELAKYEKVVRASGASVD